MTLPLPKGEGWGEGICKVKPNPNKISQIPHSSLHLAANNLWAEYSYKFPV